MCRGQGQATPGQPLGHTDHVELKTIKIQETQEEMLTFP